MLYFIQLHLFTTFSRCEAYLFAPILTGLQSDRADIPFDQSMASATRSGSSTARGTPMVDSPGGRICVGRECSWVDTELRVFVRVVVFKKCPGRNSYAIWSDQKKSAKTRWQFDMQTTVSLD
jgi:hypothetical protein